MRWISSTYDICLSSPPKILRMSGGNTHGLRPRERYRLDKFWCLNLLQGEGELHIANTVYPFRDGYACLTWPGVDLVYHFKKKTIKTWVHFIPHHSPRAARVPIPVMQDMGPEFEGIRAEVQAMSSMYRTQPDRATAKLWNLLWQLIPGDSLGSSGDSIVNRATDAINMHLAKPLSVEGLARELCVSQTHLNRLFKSTLGVTVGKYIRSQRMETSLHLLLHTSMPIKHIAYHVGIPDTQHFNKLIRQYYKDSPTRLRQQHALNR